MTRQALSFVCTFALLLVPGGGLVMAQDAGQYQQPYPQQAYPQQPYPQGAYPQQSYPQQPAGQQPQAPAPLLSPEQLDNLVAPVALYPDALLSQLLVASTYPLEVVEAGQWLAQNRNLQGQQLVAAAQQQNWDPSVQAMVVFPQALNLLNSDIRWTTDLGNAFLAQQTDVMNAVQRMRQRAQESGKLVSNQQETVSTQAQDGQNVIVVQPANPQVVYVPTYDPASVWGPPAWGYYPPLYYPAYGYGFGFGPGIFIGGFFGGLGWGGWGWGFNWFHFSIGLNFGFFNHYGFHGYGGYGGHFGNFGAGYGGFRGAEWAHNSAHRMGVPYASQAVANRFGGNFAGRGASSGFTGNAARGGFAGSAQRGGWPQAGGSVGASGHPGFGGSQPAYRGGQTFGGSSYRPAAPSTGNSNFRSAPYSGGARNVPTYRSSTPSFGSGYRSAPSTGGGFSGAHSSQSFHSSPAFNGSHSSGGGSHSFGGGGSHSGGGGSHGGGGHGGGRR